MRETTSIVRFLSSLLLVPTVQGQHWLKNQKILEGGGRANEFGHGVAIDGDNIVVAAPYNQADGLGVGGLGFFKKKPRCKKWESVGFRRVDDPQDQSALGYNSVAISGNLAIAGAVGADDRAGAAYVFARSGDSWGQQAKLTYPDALNDTGASGFGVSVDIEGTTAVIGADLAYLQGRVYVYKQHTDTSWDLVQTIIPDEDIVAFDRFGNSVDLDKAGVILAVGSPDQRFGGEDPIGTAYVYKADENDSDMYKVEIKLNGTDSEPGDRFGQSIATNGNRVVVGAGGHDVNGDNSGAAYVFKLNEDEDVWLPEIKLVPSNGASQDVFGFSVDIDDGSGVVAVGAYVDDTRAAADAGSVYIFRPNRGWREDQIFRRGCRVNEQEYFGEDVSIDGDLLLVGAWGVDDHRNEDYEDIGGAFIYGYKCHWWQVFCQVFHDGRGPDKHGGDGFFSKFFN